MNMVIHTWCALIITSFWKGWKGFIFGCWWGCLEYIQDVFLVGCTLFGRTRVLRTVFFAAPEYQVQYSTGCRLCVLKRSKNIMKHIDLSPKQRIFKRTVPKVTLNPGNFPLQLLLVGELRSCITFKFHLHWSRRRGKWMPCPWTCSLTRKHSWGIILNNADLRAVVFLFTKKWIKMGSGHHGLSTSKPDNGIHLCFWLMFILYHQETNCLDQCLYFSSGDMWAHTTTFQSIQCQMPNPMFNAFQIKSAQRRCNFDEIKPNTPQIPRQKTVVTRTIGWPDAFPPSVYAKNLTLLSLQCWLTRFASLYKTHQAIIQP